MLPQNQPPLHHPALKIPSQQPGNHLSTLTSDSILQPETYPTVAGILLTCLNPNFNPFSSMVRFSKR
jgi:hypothetical protein